MSLFFIFGLKEEQLIYLYIQRSGYGRNVFQRRVTLSPLNPTKVRPMHTCSEGEFLLRQVLR